MLPSLRDLEDQKRVLVRAISELGDFRPGSITGTVRRCGKPTCHCAHPDDPGHGPNLRLTYKVQGKTITEALPTSVAVRKAELEIAEFRKFQQLSHSFIDVNEQICRRRPMEDTLTLEEKKRPTRSSKRSRKK